MSKTHYTAVIEVTKTTHAQERTTNFPKEAVKDVRQVDEIARVVIRAETLNKLTLKASDHLELLEEEEED